MKRFLLGLWTLLASCAPAYAACTVPNAFTNGAGQIIDAAQMNANFAAIIACLTPGAPTATAGPTAVTGTASTPMASDSAPAVQKATSSLFGIVEPDGNSITVSSGVISDNSSAIGSSVNLAANQTTAAATITVTADQIVVGASTTGAPTRLGSYSKAFNGAGTGAGGMDTGAIPTSGWVCLYAIYGTSGTSILGVNCSTSSGTIYSGANMPTGYTQSALLAPLPTDGSALITRVNVSGRSAVTAAATVLNGGAATSTTSVSLTAAEPPNGKWVSGYVFMTPGVGRADDSVRIASTTNNIGIQVYFSPVASLASGGAMPPTPTPTAQTIYYFTDNAANAVTIVISGYGW